MNWMCTIPASCLDLNKWEDHVVVDLLGSRVLEVDRVEGEILVPTGIFRAHKRHRCSRRIHRDTTLQISPSSLRSLPSPKPIGATLQLSPFSRLFIGRHRTITLTVSPGIFTPLRTRLPVWTAGHPSNGANQCLLPPLQSTPTLAYSEFSPRSLATLEAPSSCSHASNIPAHYFPSFLSPPPFSLLPSPPFPHPCHPTSEPATTVPLAVDTHDSAKSTYFAHFALFSKLNLFEVEDRFRF